MREVSAWRDVRGISGAGQALPEVAWRFPIVKQLADFWVEIHSFDDTLYFIAQKDNTSINKS